MDSHVQSLVWSTSTNGEFETPQWLFDSLNTEFRLTLDVCATSENAKCQRYFTKEMDGLKQDWGGETCWCNPPYGRNVGIWVQKAWQESQKPNTTVVMLLFARTDTGWFHEYVLPYGEFRFLRGRLQFGGCSNPAPFGSMIAIFPRDRPLLTEPTP